MNEFSRELAHLVNRLDRTRKKAMVTGLREYGFSGGQHLILVYIGRRPGARQEDIAEWYFMDKGNMARSAKILEERGYIRRETDPADRRGYCLYLTPAGEKALESIRKVYANWSAGLAEKLSAEDQRIAVELLKRMLESSENLNKAD